MQFAYTAKSTTGEVLSGILDANGIDQAATRLLALSQAPLDGGIDVM